MSGWYVCSIPLIHVKGEVMQYNAHTQTVIIGMYKWHEYHKEWLLNLVLQIVQIHCFLDILHENNTDI